MTEPLVLTQHPAGSSPATVSLLPMLPPWLLPAALTLLGLLLRLVTLVDKPLWFDESWDVYAASQSINDLLAIIFFDQFHPPLHWLLLHYWITLFGDRELAARTYSVLLGTAGLPIFYLIARQFADRRTSLIALSFTAISPAIISSDQEVRGYALLMTIGLAGTYALLRLWFTGQWRWRITYSTLAALLLYTHYLGLFFVAAHAIAWILRLLLAGELRARITEVGLCYGIALVLFAPWAAVTLYEIVGLIGTGGFGTAVGMSLIDRLRLMSDSLVATLVNHSWGPSLGLFSINPFIAIAVSAGFALLLLLGTLMLLRNRAYLPIVLLVCLAIGAIGIQAIGVGHRPARYLAVVAPYFLLVLAIGLNSLRWTIVRPIGYLLLMALLTLGTIAWYRMPAGEDWRSAAAFVDREAKPNDILVINYSVSQPAFDYYSTSPLPRYGFPITVEATEPPTLGIPAQRDADAISAAQAFQSWVDDRLPHLPAGNRLWLIESHPRSGRELRAALAERYTRTSTTRFPGVRIVLYEN